VRSPGPSAWVQARSTSARDRATLSRLVSRLLVAHAADQGIDLFATDS
jgi:hypothetical protein